MSGLLDRVIPVLVADGVSPVVALSVVVIRAQRIGFSVSRLSRCKRLRVVAETDG